MPPQKNRTFFHSIYGKVIMAFLLGASAIALSWGVAQVAFREILYTVERLSTPNEKLRIINDLFQGMAQLDQLQRLQALQNPKTPTSTFLNESEHLYLSLDTLRGLVHNPLQERRIDSMQSMLQNRDKQFVRYLEMRSELLDNEGLSRQIKSLYSWVNRASHKVDTSIITTRQKVTMIMVPPDTASRRVTKTESKGLIGRIFSKKKPEERAKPKPWHRTVQEEVQEKKDTLALTKRDSVAVVVNRVMTTIQKEQKKKGEELVSRELDLLYSANTLNNQMLAILQVLQEEEIRQAQKNTVQATAVVNTSIDRIQGISIIFFLGAAVLVYFIFIDVARSNRYRKQLLVAKEEAEHLGQVKQRFLSNISHELRTPLQSILGYSELVLKEDKPKQQHLQAIHRSSEHLLHIVNEVLDYSRIVAGKFTFEVRRFNMNQLLDEVAQTMQMQAERKSLHFTLEHPFTEAFYCSGDPFRLKQILYNLLGNAIKFTEEGSVSLVVEADMEPVKPRLTFTVKDTGIGIAKSDLSRIFKQFEQAELSTVGASNGTGLGLNIVKSLVEIQGGTIEVDSTPGEGTSFIVALDFDRAEREEKAAQSATTSVEAQFKGKVMLIDDDSFILQLCGAILDNYGKPYISYNSSEAVLNDPWDPEVNFVLMDIRMPHISGLELCSALRERVPASTRIIALTAQALPEEREAILHHGFDGLLMKPFTEEEFIHILNHYTMSHHEVPVPEQDLSAIIKMSGGDQRLVGEILRSFTEETQRDIIALRQEVIEKNTAQVSELVHRLAGRCGLVGAKELSATFRRIEVALNREEPLEKFHNELLRHADEAERLRLSITEQAAAMRAG